MKKNNIIFIPFKNERNSTGKLLPKKNIDTENKPKHILLKNNSNDIHIKVKIKKKSIFEYNQLNIDSYITNFGNFWGKKRKQNRSKNISLYNFNKFVENNNKSIRKWTPLKLNKDIFKRKVKNKLLNYSFMNKDFLIRENSSYKSSLGFLLKKNKFDKKRLNLYNINKFTYKINI